MGQPQVHQYADLYQPIVASKIGPAPVYLRVAVVPNNDHVQGGAPESRMKGEVYVRISSLPAELQERVKASIQTIQSSI